MSKLSFSMTVEELSLALPQIGCGVVTFFVYDVFFSAIGAQPPTVACKMEARLEYIHIAHTFCARVAPICTLGRCLLTKISASELSRKFAKGALLVGMQEIVLHSLQICFGRPSILYIYGDLTQKKLTMLLILSRVPLWQQHIVYI